MNEANIKFEIITPESAREPRIWVVQQPSLGLALQPGSIEVGFRRSEMKKFTYDTGEIRLTPRLQKWFRVGEVELRGADYVLDERVSGLAATLNAERIAGFPNRRLFS